ncbi:MAG: sensor domain-containing diguanylate cyclase [Alphaproteobacteria bacterium]|nr:sensor domain-containing diguanylate cyclase [Alphaproteobacteria bacterium]
MNRPDTKLGDEEARALALERYDVLDTGPERPFENIVSLVEQTLRVPICAVSLVDRHRQWFKARRGLDVSETPRDISFCTHAIRQPDAFVVNDATVHPTFRDNPLVTGEPHIRAYLGIPLKTPEGYQVGSLCAIDTQIRGWASHEIAILTNFAKIVVDELELRQIASSDGLTGAMTRRAWTEVAEAEIKRATRYGRSLCLAILDIDNFKSVNDTYGHPAGDIVIQQLAGMGMELMRRSDRFGRLGGEEFALVIPEAELAEAKLFAERLRKEFADKELDIGEKGTIHCTISIGIAEWTPSENLEGLMARADKCLYAAKRGGRNRTVVAGPYDTAIGSES